MLKTIRAAAVNAVVQPITTPVMIIVNFMPDSVDIHITLSATASCNS